MGEDENVAAVDATATPAPRVDWERAVGLLTTVVTLASLWLAADPDGPARLWYGVRLWWAYRRAPINRQYLVGMRYRAAAGVYADDMTPTTTRIGEY